MEKIILFISLIFLFGCNPCKFVSKHPECFSADTIRLIDKVITTEKEYIIKDSIHYDTIECDELNKAVIETVYVTKWKIKTDSVFVFKETSKINPINTELQKDNSKLSNKVDSLKKWLKMALGGLLLSIIIAIILFKI